METPMPRHAMPAALTQRSVPILVAMFTVGSAIAIVLATTGVASAAPPPKLPGNADAAEQKWQPAYDYDGDSCYPSPAIGPGGILNGGLDPNGVIDGKCRDQSDLDNANGYARYKCNNGWCAYAYALYFEKDQMLDNVKSGHRHDWEHVVVWVQDDQARYVSASQHGDFTVHTTNVVRWEGTHPKIVYHKDGLRSHTFRLGGDNDEPPDNHYRSWQFPTLVGWNGYPAGARDALSHADFGSAVFDLKDSHFNKMLGRAQPAGIPFNSNA
jgi:hypothetical protein